MRKILLAVVATALACGSSGSSGGNGTGDNHSPVVDPLATNPAVVIGQSTLLQARATDQDGDGLTYSWTQTSPTSPQGTFSSTTSESPTWTAPAVGATTPFTLAVTVSDRQGGPTTASVTVYVKTSTDTSFVAEVMPILERCAGCHQGAQPPGALSLEANKGYAQLVNVPARSSCATQPRVKPGDPDGSVLVLKMIGTACGTRMPPGNPTYFDQLPAELATVRTWIQQGAQRN